MQRLIAAAGLALLFAGAAGAQPAAKSVPFEPKTQVDGKVLQVMLRNQALFRLDDGGLPVLDSVQEGQLAVAHPPGAATESFAAPPAGMIAAAVDGSVEKHATFLKVWNHTAHSIQYRAMALEMMQGNTLHPVIVEPCPVPPGGVRTESWPAPIIAVGLSNFRRASPQALARCGGAKPAGPKPSLPKKGK